MTAMGDPQPDSGEPPDEDFDPRAGIPMKSQFEDLARRIERDYARTGGFGGIWAVVVPEVLRSRTHVRSYQHGVLTVWVADAATRFELDRLLRTGLEQELRRRAPATLRRVRLILG
jgi:hypothetical protein